ncbi:MAG: hypothetical protein RIB63_09005, partial [Fulvivirga sp.]
MKKLFLVLISTYLISCGKTEEFSAATIEGLAELPAGAIKEPYDDNPDMVKVTINRATGNAEGDYLNGQRVGTWTEYHQTGLVKSSASYVNGVQQGLFTEIDDRGQLQRISYYHNGQLHGSWKEFNRARVKEERTYKNGKIEGVVKVYYDTGNIMEEGV